MNEIEEAKAELRLLVYEALHEEAQREVYEELIMQKVQNLILITRLRTRDELIRILEGVTFYGSR